MQKMLHEFARTGGKKLFSSMSSLKIGNSILGKLILSLVSIITITLLLVGIVTFTNTKTEVKRQFISSAEQVLRQNQNYVDFIVETIETQSNQLFSDAGIRDKITASYTKMSEKYTAASEVSTNLRKITLTNSFIDSIYILNPGYLSVREPQMQLFDINLQAETKLYQLAAGQPGRHLWLPPHQDEFTLDDTKVISDVRFSRDFGLLAINISPKLFQEALAKATFGKAGYMFITDQQGNIISHPDSKLLGKNIKASGEVKQLLTLRAPEGHFSYTAVQKKRTEMFAVYSTSAKNGWKYVAVLPSAELTVSADKIRNIIIIISLISLLVGLVISCYIFQRVIARPIHNLTAATRKMALGDCDVRVELKSRDEIGVLAESFNAMVANIREGAQAAQRIAAGDLNLKLQVKSGQDLLNQNLNHMIENIKALVDDVNTLSDAAIAGQLAVRVDLARHNGQFREIVAGVNQTLDAIVDPIKEASAVLQQISQGNLQVAVKGNYLGDYQQIKDALNLTAASLQGYIGEISRVLTAMSLGDLEVAITAEYRGEFVAIKEALNAMVANIREGAQAAQLIAAGDLNVKLKVKSEADLLNLNLNHMIENIKALVDDVNRLSEAAIAGRLAVRADLARHSGEFRQIVAGVNQTLDAIVDPIKEAATVLQQISLGNLQVAVKGDYQGDYQEIKDALNRTTESLQGYIGEISAVLTEISQGNLDVAITNEYRGDFAEIKSSINLVIDTFNEVLRELNTAARQVASEAVQIADSSQLLAQSASEQASTVEELTASITEIAAQTTQNAGHAGQANQLALAAKEKAVEGNGQMKELLQAMELINQSSVNISNIIKVIDEIAFQTNILALNAAVEAARAGQHGKGFAVVAQEVRNLAARSADAAKETTALIESSIAKVAIGTKITNETAVALREIVESVSRTTELMSEIATASHEQASGITQINQGINQVSLATQSNTATSEESAATSEELSARAERLKVLVSHFKLKNHTQQEQLLISGPPRHKY